jgi:predicted MFS family arabinose efflux permease
VLVLDAASFWAGLAFFDGEIVLPILLSRLGATDSLIGLARLIQTLGFTLPALFAAHTIHGRTNHKQFLLWTCGIGRSGLLLLPPLLFFYARSRPGLVLASFYIFLAVFWTMDGASAVSWFDIIAKTIPTRVRGRFFGVMQMTGGVAALGAGFVVRLILQDKNLAYPTNFALLACFWCIGVAGSQIFLMMIREPAGVVVEEEEKPGFMDYLRQAFPLLRRRDRLRKLIFSRLLLDGASMATPFYVLFARKDLVVTLTMIGLYTIMKSVGRVCTGPLWGWVSDRYGPATGLRSVAFSIFLIPILALLAARGAVWLLPITFLLLGAVQDGIWMTGSNVLLEAVEEVERPLAVGVVTVFQSPGAIYSVLGGLLAERTSYPVVFCAALIMAGCGLWMTFQLPRKLDARYGGQNRA